MSNLYSITYSNDYLAHHGVLGMKWGVRRYQNADGTLTDKGKKRYFTTYNRKGTTYTTQSLKQEKLRYKDAKRNARKMSKDRSEYRTAKSDIKEARRNTTADRTGTSILTNSAKAALTSAAITGAIAAGSYFVTKKVFNSMGVKDLAIAGISSGKTFAVDALSAMTYSGVTTGMLYGGYSFATKGVRKAQGYGSNKGVGTTYETVRYGSKNK